MWSWVRSLTVAYERAFVGRGHPLKWISIPRGLISCFLPEDTLGNQKIIETIFSLWVYFNFYRQTEKTTVNVSVKEPYSNTLPLWPRA